MKLRQILIGCAALLFVTSVQPQTPDTKHFDKDGLSFDYPGKWQMSDQSTQQMQFFELSQGDVVIRVRSPREWLKTPEKEAHAKKLFQDQYVDNFATQVEQAGLTPKRSPVTTQIGGTDAEGTRLRANLDGQPGSHYLGPSGQLIDHRFGKRHEKVSSRLGHDPQYFESRTAARTEGFTLVEETLTSKLFARL